MVWVLWFVKVLLWVLIGIGAAMHPTVSSGRFQWPTVGRYGQWVVSLGVTLLLIVVDGVAWYGIMHYVRKHQTMALDWLNQWQWDIVLAIVGTVALIGVLQLLHVVDITHHSRHAKADYEQWKANILSLSWEERYIQEHAGSWGACACALLFTCRSSWRYTWPYVIWALLWRIVYMLALPFVLTLSWVGQWLAIADAMPLQWMLLGFLAGHMGEKHIRTWAHQHPQAYHGYMKFHHIIISLGIILTVGLCWAILHYR